MLRIKILVLLLLTYFSGFAQGSGVGKRIDFTQKLHLGSSQFAQLFIPDYYQPSEDGKFLLVFHFHSASWAAEDELYKSHTNGVLFNIHLGAVSSSYQNYFIDSKKFGEILTLVKQTLADQKIIENPQIKNLIVTSFSAGYGGVREVLKNQDYYNMIDALTLADGLHSNLDSTWMKIQMQDFLRFAKDARDEKKIMLLTHSSIPTPTYASTTQTANYLIHFIGAKRVSYFHVDEIGQQYSRCDTGNFHLKGYYGTTAEDHLKHLYAMHIMLKQAVELLNATPVERKTNESMGFYLEQNYPNPFGSASASGSAFTTITYSLPSYDAEQTLSFNIYDVLGRKVKTMLTPAYGGRENRIVIRENALSSGVYFYSLQYGVNRMVKKMVLLK